jgi:polyisoprenyl-phosphate glycosyltransferase
MQQLLNPTLSVVVPVYGNAGSIAQLVEALSWIAERHTGAFEAVLVVDGSPDASQALLLEQLPRAPFRSQLISLTRNFGAFPAIRVGLEKARGDVIAVMAADLQEPPELVMRFLAELSSGNHDMAFGVREARQDPFLSRIASGLFWAFYRRFVMPDIPKGGVDIFALTRPFRDRLLCLGESHTNLLAQLFWLGGRRAFVGYRRREREQGKSAWTLRKKLRYLSDSIFAFTDLPIRVLIFVGSAGMAVAALLAVIIVIAKLSAMVEVPGYAGTMLAILFFGALNSLGLGVVGAYAWRAFENTKARPLAIIQTEFVFSEESA